MNRKRLEEIKKHMRLHAPKNIHAELAELFKYIAFLEGKNKVVETQKQGSLLGNCFEWQLNLAKLLNYPDRFKKYATALGMREEDAREQAQKALKFLK